MKNDIISFYINIVLVQNLNGLKPSWVPLFIMSDQYKIFICGDSYFCI